MDDADLRGFDQRLADQLDEVGRLVRRGSARARVIASASVCAPSSSSVATQVSSPRLPEASTLAYARALHALELLELALEPLGDAGQRDDRRATPA